MVFSTFEIGCFTTISRISLLLQEAYSANSGKTSNLKTTKNHSTI